MNTATLDELLDLVAQGIPEMPDDGATAQEMADATGISRDTVLKRLRPHLRSGAVVQGWAYREGIDGRRQRVPVYRRARG